MTRNSTATPELVQPQTSPYFGSSAPDRETPAVATAQTARATQSSSQVSGIDGALLEAESKIEQVSAAEAVKDFLPFQ